MKDEERKRVNDAECWASLLGRIVLLIEGHGTQPAEAAKGRAQNPERISPCDCALSADKEFSSRFLQLK